MKNVHNAVWIIATLSLLLGLSLGQLHQKHRELEKAKNSRHTISRITIKKSNNCFDLKNRHDNEAQARMDRIRARARLDQIRAQFEREKVRLELEKDRIRREAERAVRKIERDKTHILLREEL